MDDADELRGRLRDARGAGPPALDDEAYGRIVQHMVQHGPTHVRRSRRRRSLLRAGAVMLPLALIGSWLGLRGQPDSAERPARLAAGATSPPCASLGALRPSAAPRPDRSELFDLGAIGQIVLEPGSEAHLNAADPCRLQLQLTAGRASVHAANLFGGELTVRAGDTEVVVRGTTFAVERANDEILVDVEAGAVSVERAGHAVAGLVKSGQRLRLSRTSAAVVLPLAEESRAQLRARFEVALQRPASVREAAQASEPALARAEAKRDGAQGASASPARGTAPPTAATNRRDDPTANVPRGATAPTDDGVRIAAVPLDEGAEPYALAPAGTEPRELTARRVAERLGDRASAAAARNATRQGSARVAQHDAAERARDAAQPSAAVTTPARARSDAAALVARADGYWKAGALEQARASYRAAGALSGPTAEAAWLSLARKELADGRTEAAREALASHARRFPEGKLASEAAGIELRTALQAKDYSTAERVARRLAEHYAGTPQAEAASRWLHARESSTR
jgi:hypothetical protein